VKELDGKVALVTGVGRPEGIGVAICQKLAAEGANVFYTYWHPYDTEHFTNTIDPDEFTQLLAKQGVQAEGVEMDLSRPDSPQKLFRLAHDKFRHVDFLINNACYDRSVPFTELSDAILDKHYAVNLRATALLCSAFVRAWTEKSGGRIINVTSGQSYGPMNVDQIPYTTTKAGLEMLAVQLAPGIKELGITINAIDPGPTDTGWMDEGLKAKLQQESIVNQPYQVAEAIYLLLLDSAADKTGQVVHVGR